jgi:hypothetical protein
MFISHEQYSSIHSFIKAIIDKLNMYELHNIGVKRNIKTLIAAPEKIIH